MTDTVVISTKASEYFAQQIANGLSADILPVERLTFGGVETYSRLVIDDWADLFGQNVVFVASTQTDEEINELYRLGCALSGYGVKQLIFCIPFLGYSTMERATKPGEVVTAKTIARQFSAIPRCALNNVFLMMDLHVSGLVHYFEGDCTRFEVQSELLLARKIWTLQLKDFIMASADLGRSKYVERLANSLSTEIAFIRKVRTRNETEVKTVIGDVAGQQVVIYDDMTRSAGTLIKAAKAYLKNEALNVRAILSHLALNDESVAQMLIDSPIKQVIATNSHPASQWSIVQQSRKFAIIDVSPIFIKLIKRILGQS